MSGGEMKFLGKTLANAVNFARTLATMQDVVANVAVSDTVVKLAIAVEEFFHRKRGVHGRLVYDRGLVGFLTGRNDSVNTMFIEGWIECLAREIRPCNK